MIRIFDTFTDTDAVLLPNHTPDIDREAGGWTAVAGVWDILANEAKVTSFVNARAVIDAGIYDGRFKVDLKVGLVDGRAALIFRYKDANEYWYVRLSDDDQDVSLREMTAGGEEVRAHAAFAQDEATWYEIKVLCQGDFIEAYIDDVLLLIHASESLQSETDAGIQSPMNPNARFDNFIVDDRPTCLYCITVDVKARFGEQWTSGVKFDVVLEDWIASASRLIDMELRWGDCYFAIDDLTDEVRRFDTEAGSEMFIDECVSITTLTIDTTGNGTPDTVWVEGVDFVVDPYNKDSFNRIIVKEDASVSFPTGQRRLEIVGKFGGFATPPQLVKEMCAITVARWFKRGMQAYQDTGAIVELGQLTYTKALDPDVKEILAQYGRHLVV